MPTSVTTDRPAAVLGHQEHQVLSAVGCGLRDDEVAAALAIPEDAVAEHLARILVKLGLRDRAAAIVHAFDCGLVVPGRGPRTGSVRSAPRAVTARAAGPGIRLSMLGPLRAWRDGRPLDLGHLRQQAVLAALALGAGRSLSQQELLDDVWGMEPPVANVVPVYIYRLRKALRAGDGPDSVIERGLRGYQLVSGAVDVDVARMEELVTGIGKAGRAGEPLEAVRLCDQALELFRAEPLAGLPGPLAELERLRLTERRIAIVQRKLTWQLRLGQPPLKVSHCENAAFGPVGQEWLAVVALMANTSTRPSTDREVASSASGIPPVPVHADHEVGLVCQRWNTPSAFGGEHLEPAVLVVAGGDGVSSGAEVLPGGPWGPLKYRETPDRSSPGPGTVFASGRSPFPGATSVARGAAVQEYGEGRAPLRMDHAVPPFWRALAADCLAPTHDARAPHTAESLLARIAAHQERPQAGSGRLGGRARAAALATALCGIAGAALYSDAVRTPRPHHRAVRTPRRPARSGCTTPSRTAGSGSTGTRGAVWAWRSIPCGPTPRRTSYRPGCGTATFSPPTARWPAGSPSSTRRTGGPPAGSASASRPAPSLPLPGSPPCAPGNDRHCWTATEVTGPGSPYCWVLLRLRVTRGGRQDRASEGVAARYLPRTPARQAASLGFSFSMRSRMASAVSLRRVPSSR